jgi:hypothetical protein
MLKDPPFILEVCLRLHQAVRITQQLAGMRPKSVA